MSERQRIETLSQSVANRIAAGEVVERPASVLKELIENSLDAEAKNVTIVVEDAGRSLIRVVDDGLGMSGTDLAAALGRHATSKLRNFEDIESLRTFGFRGEALPSIASVCRLDIISRTHDEDVGTHLSVAGGKVEKCDPVSCDAGTSISVGHLFYNVPARRKFLRTDATEFKWITNVFKHFALAFPDVSWKLIRGKETVHNLPAGDGRKRMAGLFGDDVAEEMVRVDYTQDWMSVKGWISPPSMTMRNNQEQYLYLNKRPISAYRINRTIYNAAEPYYVAGGHPVYVILCDAEPDRFDINVHPAKKEVKFADERSATGIVGRAIRVALGAAVAPQGLADNTPADRSQPPSMSDYRQGETSYAPRVDTGNPGYMRPVFPSESPQAPARGQSMPFPQIPRNMPPGQQTGDVFDPEPMHERMPERPKVDADGPVIWQIFDTYLLSPLKTGVVMIDQHVAHERILYEKALNAMNSEPWTSQQLLFPTRFEVSHADDPFVEEAIPLLRAMGFEIENTGPREYRILSAPSGVKIASEREMLLGIVSEFRETADVETDPRKRLAAAFSCRGAIKAGKPLEPPEMQRLVDDLFQCDDPEFCPHGRPIYHVISLREIEKWFKR